VPFNFILGNAEFDRVIRAAAARAAEDARRERERAERIWEEERRQREEEARQIMAKENEWLRKYREQRGN